MNQQQKIEQLYKLLRRATLVSVDRAVSPEIGDVVIETSKFPPDPLLIGTLESLEVDNNGNPVYAVTSLEGQLQRWQNSDARTVWPRANLHRSK